MIEKKKITVGIIFGGKSAEHEISLKSTEAILKNINRKEFSPILIYINPDGFWNIVDEETFIKKDFPIKTGFSFLPWLDDSIGKIDADIYFPMLHGPNGEDGKIHSVIELAGKPYAGANSFGSALAMDKVVSKILFKNAGLNVGDYLYFQKNDYDYIRETIRKNMDYPVFTKPCAMGSSVGISKVKSEPDLRTALDIAFNFDKKILVEKALQAREIEVSVMGNDQVEVSRPGELIPFNEFYDYNDKYIDSKTTFKMPAELSSKIEEEIRTIAKKAFQALFLNGMSRVDLFLDKNTLKIYVNEINTIPGFTDISMFPKLWTIEGISFTELITRLINYGFDYHRRGGTGVE